MRKPLLLGLATIAVATAACGISDEDRCSDGQTYVAERGICQLPPVMPQDSGVVATSTQTDAGASGGSGLGTSCAADADCAGLSADYCLLNPQAPSDPGICTLQNCAAAADCATPGFACCDCAGVALVSWPAALCVPDANATSVSGLGCSCS